MKKGLTILRLHNHIVFCEFMKNLARNNNNLIDEIKWRKYKKKADDALLKLIIENWNL